jgi:L-2-hydroxyglutarate oxidase LhgO
MIQDFYIQRQGSAIHVLNAPSPGATASLAIGEEIAKQLEITEGANCAMSELCSGSQSTA